MDSFINELLMLKKPAIIVEGLNDITVYENLFNITGTRFTVTSPALRYARNQGGKGRVIQIIDYTSKRCTFNQRKKIIGIIDADFDHCCNIIRKRQNLFLTDKHDIETQIISSGAFKKFVNSFYKRGKVRNPLQKIDEIRNYCLQKSMDFGIWLLGLYKIIIEGISKETPDLYVKLRLYTIIKNKLGGIKDFITVDVKNNEVYIEKAKIGEHFLKILNPIEDTIKNRLFKIFQFVTDLRKKDIDPYQCVSGHDTIVILAFMSILKMLGLEIKGSNDKKIVNILNNNNEFFYFCKELETKLRNSYELTHFKRSNLYKEIVNYNGDYNIS